mmetsp:Transcript_57332/g.166423  ORF Transcript_57332/g.166423 Transcript_57332/m.166423 type:complete len:212 (+) Transcript_57332:983-1618(+)
MPQCRQVPVHEEGQPMIDQVQVDLGHTCAHQIVMQLDRILEAVTEGLLGCDVHTVRLTPSPMVYRRLRPLSENCRRDAQVQCDAAVRFQARGHVCGLCTGVPPRPYVDRDPLKEACRAAIPDDCLTLPPLVLLQPDIQRREGGQDLGVQLFGGVWCVHRDMDVYASDLVEVPASEGLVDALPDSRPSQGIIPCRSEEHQSVFGSACRGAES